eukprot:gene5363-7113_t
MLDVGQPVFAQHDIPGPVTAHHQNRLHNLSSTFAPKSMSNSSNFGNALSHQTTHSLPQSAMSSTLWGPSIQNAKPDFPLASSTTLESQQHGNPLMSSDLDSQPTKRPKIQTLEDTSMQAGMRSSDNLSRHHLPQVTKDPVSGVNFLHSRLSGSPKRWCNPRPMYDTVGFEDEIPTKRARCHTSLFHSCENPQAVPNQSLNTTPAQCTSSENTARGDLGTSLSSNHIITANNIEEDEDITEIDIRPKECRSIQPYLHWVDFKPTPAVPRPLSNELIRTMYVPADDSFLHLWPQCLPCAWCYGYADQFALVPYVPRDRIIQSTLNGSQFSAMNNQSNCNHTSDSSTSSSDDERNPYKEMVFMDDTGDRTWNA